MGEHHCPAPHLRKRVEALEAQVKAMTLAWSVLANRQGTSPYYFAPPEPSPYDIEASP